MSDLNNVKYVMRAAIKIHTRLASYLFFCECYRYYLATKFEQSVVQAIEGGDDDSVRRLLSTAVSTFKSEQGSYD